MFDINIRRTKRMGGGLEEEKRMKYIQQLMDEFKQNTRMRQHRMQEKI